MVVAKKNLQDRELNRVRNRHNHLTINITDYVLRNSDTLYTFFLRARREPQCF